MGRFGWNGHNPALCADYSPLLDSCYSKCSLVQLSCYWLARQRYKECSTSQEPYLLAVLGWIIAYS